MCRKAGRLSPPKRREVQWRGNRGKILQSFNQLNDTRRDLTQLINLWSYTKINIKKRDFEYRRNYNATGGSPRLPSHTCYLRTEKIISLGKISREINGIPRSRVQKAYGNNGSRT
ncbi:unnamed protein product [Parnassius apollo]|uniref:(apollo) hypothetical protein n=1 Tax=Parnassius apollo TaxID=110799 RepID=A0A8S3WWM7_PARAO|nr:unnamed protein product [Parnassius apollo]